VKQSWEIKKKILNNRDRESEFVILHCKYQWRTNKEVTRSQAKSAQSSQVEVKPSAMSKPPPKAQSKPTAQQKAINQPSFAPANHVFKVNKIIVHC